MPISLHAALVPGWLQILRATRALVDKAETHCNETGIDAAELLQTRLIDDMLPLAYQFKSCSVHSQGAIEGVRRGSFSPDRTEPPATFAGIAAQLDAAAVFLASLDPAELEGFTDKEVVFGIGENFRREFTADNFLLGFSQPNFFFHATTAYNILRMTGFPIGKGNFIGVMPARG